METETRDFKGIWIPREIYLHPDLTWTEKMLYCEIDSLDGEDGCFASNEYFAKFFGVGVWTISNGIKKLKDLGFISQESFDGRRRVLKAEFRKITRQGCEKSQGRIEKNHIHNNIDYNTSLDNNKTINSFIMCDPNENCSQECQNGSICSRPAVFNFNGQSYCGQHFRIAMDKIIKEIGGSGEIKIKENKTDFIPPTIDECRAYAREIHCWKELGEDVYNLYSMNGWKDTRGRPIKNWKLKMYQWYIHDKEKYKDYSDMPCYQEQKDEDFVRAKPLRIVE